MIFETHILGKSLSDHIESIFYYKGFMPDHSIERVVPTGHVFIIFELDGIVRHTYDKDALKPNGSYKNVWVSGMHKNHLSISSPQNSEMLVIQFKTIGSHPFINIPIHTLNNRVINAEELFGTTILELRNTILKHKDISEKFKSVENWLLGRFISHNTPSSVLTDMLCQLKTQHFTESSKLVESYPNSQKHLINQFKIYFGLTPKVFHRIFRFNEILNQIQNKNELVWSQIAYEFGYADQSHFIKEFKEFSGFNPQEFLNSDHHNNDETNFFPLDRKG